MSALECLACEYKNPSGAKFCAECGAQLNLKLCKHCEAINERAWERCYNCGAVFRGERAAALLSAAPAESQGRIPNFSWFSLVPLRRKRSTRGQTRAAAVLLGGLALAGTAALVYYLYWQPNQTPIAIELVTGTPKYPSTAVLPAASITSAAASGGTADISTTKSRQSVLPASTSPQRYSGPNQVPKLLMAARSTKTHPAAVTGDSAVNTSAKSDDPRSVMYPGSTETAAAATAAPTRDTSSANAPRPVSVSGSRYPISPDDFHFSAPPP